MSPVTHQSYFISSVCGFIVLIKISEQPYYFHILQTDLTKVHFLCGLPTKRNWEFLAILLVNAIAMHAANWTTAKFPKSLVFAWVTPRILWLLYYWHKSCLQEQKTQEAKGNRVNLKKGYWSLCELNPRGLTIWFLNFLVLSK